jgi:hypothetical protein
MTGAAYGRQIDCYYWTETRPLWPNYVSCYTPSDTDFSAYYENEEHYFSLTDGYSKSDINTFYIWGSSTLDFIPLDIVTEFPYLNGIYIISSNLPTVKSGFFKEELSNIEYLFLGSNNIEVIQPEAFQYLVYLKWINLYYNQLKTLSYRLFKDNPYLIYINLQGNQIASIHSNFFAGLNNLKLVDFSGNSGCINDNIGCETCSITQSDLRGKLQGCFDKCSKGTTCMTSYLAHETSPISITENPIESDFTKKVVEEIGKLINQKLEESSQNCTASSRDTQKAVEAVEKGLVDLGSSVENMPKVIEKAIENNNQNMQECCATNQNGVEKVQEAMENQVTNLKSELAVIIQQKLDAMEKRLESGG